MTRVIKRAKTKWVARVATFKVSDLVLKLAPSKIHVVGFDLVITGVGAPGIGAPDFICFIEAEKYLESFKKSSCRAWLITPEIFSRLPNELTAEKIFLITDKPYLNFVRIVNLFHPPPKVRPGIHSTAIIHPTAQVHPTAQIEAHVVIQGHVKIGADTVLYPGVWVGEYSEVGEGSILYGGAKVYHNCIVGKRNILHAGAVVGSDGFGFLPDASRLLKIPQVGRAILHDDIEVGANSTIDRGTIEDTVIGSGTKIDNLVQIGHNCKIGQNCIFCAFVGVSGNTIIGNNVLLAGQVGTKGHMKIGDNVQVGAQSGVSKDVPSNSKVKGYPPQPLKDYLRLQVLIQKLPDLYKRLIKLEETKS
jgi:UDP-3-O-[3-hydroxymyristoyl] glucosamine N-acyltransferase